MFNVFKCRQQPNPVTGSHDYEDWAHSDTKKSRTFAPQTSPPRTTLPPSSRPLDTPLSSNFNTIQNTSQCGLVPHSY